MGLSRASTPRTLTPALPPTAAPVQQVIPGLGPVQWLESQAQLPDTSSRAGATQQVWTMGPPWSPISHITLMQMNLRDMNLRNWSQFLSRVALLGATSGHTMDIVPITWPHQGQYQTLAGKPDSCPWYESKLEAPQGKGPAQSLKDFTCRSVRSAKSILLRTSR